MLDLPAGHQEALFELHDRLTTFGIRYQLGGSGMLLLRGISVEIDDLDLVFAADVRERIPIALGNWWEGFTTIQDDHFASDWFARITVNDVPVDLIGGFTIKDEGTLPFRVTEYAMVVGVPIPLAPVENWVRIYNQHDPRKAALLRNLASPK